MARPVLHKRLGKNGRELDVGFLQQFVDAVHVLSALLFEATAVAGQITQIALGLWGNKGRFE